MTDPRPTVGNVAEELYESLTPLAWSDADLGWHLLLYCEAAGSMLEQVDGYVRDNDALGLPGWGILFDVDNCPEEALGYLAQFVGVTLLGGDTAAQSRARILATDGFRRGTVAAMREAIAATLTGTQTVVLRERFNPNDATDPLRAYHLQVKTYTAETTDATVTEAAFLSQKPAGIVGHFEVVDGQDWTQLAANYATWADVVAAYDDWADVAADTP